jgi:acetyltransferase-like isoleucine patch superfamily enzyme
VLCAHIPVGAVTQPIFALGYRVHVAVREGFAFACRFFWYEPLFRSQCSVIGSSFRMDRLPYMVGRGRITIGNHVHFSGKPQIGFYNRFYETPELAIGDHTFVGHECELTVAQSITIGAHCLLAGGVRMADFDGHPQDATKRRLNQPIDREAVKPIVIGDDVWIGRGACILKGVTVGNRSIIGTEAVVVKDVPSDVVVAGNPARVVKELAKSREPHPPMQK